MAVEGDRFYQPDDLPFVRLAPAGASGLGSAFVNFAFPTPDPRILLKLAVVFFQEASQTGLTIPFDVTLGGIVQWALNLQAADRSPTGAFIPTTNILGAGQTLGATAQTIPLAIDTVTPGNNLCGFSIDIQHGADAVVGLLQMLLVGSLAAKKGVTAVMRARWTVQGEEMSDRDWKQARGQMAPTFNPQVALL